MKQWKRREFLKTSAGVAAGATAGPFIWVKDASAQWSNTPEKGRTASRVALEPVRPGRHRSVHEERPGVHREDRHRSASR